MAAGAFLPLEVSFDPSSAAMSWTTLHLNSSFVSYFHFFSYYFGPHPSSADCVSVKGADPPYIKDTYPAEAMAEVVVANLYKSKTIQCMASCPGVLRELGGLQVMTLCSLGPSDGLFCINDRMVSWGRPAMIVKGTIEVTKMSDSRNEFFGRSFWSMVPHW